MNRALAVVCLTLFTCHASAVETTRFRDAKGRVVSVAVSKAALIHTTQLIPQNTTVSETAQGEQVLQQLQDLLDRFNRTRSDVVKLNVSVRDTSTRELFERQLAEWFAHKGPAASFVASRLPESDAAIGLDAIVAIERRHASTVPAGKGDYSVLPPGDVIYISGQAASGNLRDATRETMGGLLKTVKHLGLTARDIIQVKCFVKPISEVAVANEEIARALGESRPPVVHVEWTSGSRAIEIEMIVAVMPQKASGTVSYITPPWMKSSPVFSRVARIRGDSRIYVSGLYPAEAGDGQAQVESIFSQLEAALAASGSDMRHLAKATYYVSDDDASSKLNQLRPSYYDPDRPPAASKAAVASVAAEGLGITIDMIAAPARGNGVRVIKNVAYLGADRAEKMDLYLPTGRADAPRPAVLIIHGGGWQGGDKAANRELNIGNTLAAAGYVCASINYELAKKSEHLGERLRSVWPRNIYDCKSAVRYLRAHADEYSIDPANIGAIGGSAGGHLVAMLAATDAEDGFDDGGLYRDQSSRIGAVVPMYGVHDVLGWANEKGNEMTDADVDLCRRASPITYVSSDDPPALILHGTKDAIVPVKHSEILHEHLQNAGVASQLVIVEGAPHSFHLEPKQRDLRALVIGFFDQHLKPAKK